MVSSNFWNSSKSRVPFLSVWAQGSRKTISQLLNRRYTPPKALWLFGNS